MFRHSTTPARALRPEVQQATLNCEAIDLLRTANSALHRVHPRLLSLTEGERQDVREHLDELVELVESLRLFADDTSALIGVRA
jgi:hypothetical protein